MPELPEVETTIRQISNFVNNTKIINIQMFTKKLRWKIKPTIKYKFINHNILNIHRIGKYIIIPCSNQKSLIVHLGMSGYLRLEDRIFKKQKHDHVIISFLKENNVKNLILNDQRRFGHFDYQKSSLLNQHFLLKELGLDGLSKKLDVNYLKLKFKNRNSNIKNILLNQKIISGIGNIYASEILYRSNIDPLKKARCLNDIELKKLRRQIFEVLKEAVKNGGTTIKDFRQPSGKLGYFQQKLNVYGRDGLNCFNCNTKVILIRISNRATYFCPKCQD